MNQLGVGTLPWVTIHQPILIGEDQQRIGINEISDQSRQGVVVAQPNFIGHHRIVLVHDWQHLHAKERAESTAGIQIAIPGAHVSVAEQDLCSRHAVGAEAFLIGPHQCRLPDCRRRLREMDLMWTLTQMQARKTGHDGTTGHQHNIAPTRAQRR